MATILSKRQWLKLVKTYLDKYHGKYVEGTKGWVELRTPSVQWGSEEVARQADAMIDRRGDLWWIREELEPMEAAEKIKTADEVIGIEELDRK